MVYCLLLLDGETPALTCHEFSQSTSIQIHSSSCLLYTIIFDCEYCLMSSVLPWNIFILDEILLFSECIVRSFRRRLRCCMIPCEYFILLIINVDCKYNGVAVKIMGVLCSIYL